MESELPVKKKQQHELSLDFYQGISCFSHNMSPSGMLCYSSKQISEMTLLDIRFQLPAEKGCSGPDLWVECVGVVIRCERKVKEDGEHPYEVEIYEVEIFFEKMSKKHRDLLAAFSAGKAEDINKKPLKVFG